MESTVEFTKPTTWRTSAILRPLSYVLITLTLSIMGRTFLFLIQLAIICDKKVPNLKNCRLTVNLYKKIKNKIFRIC